jgi:hypothetical protein
MGHGIDAARADSPHHAALMDELKDQLLIVFLKRLGGGVAIPVAEIDDTGMDLLAFRIDDRQVFHFSLSRKS